MVFLRVSSLLPAGMSLSEQYLESYVQVINRNKSNTIKPLSKNHLQCNISGSDFVTEKLIVVVCIPNDIEFSCNLN